MDTSSIPIIDVASLVARAPATATARALRAACRQHGFFYVVGHGVSAELQRELLRASRRFFAAAPKTKLALRMERGGRAWRGYFPLGAELTLGRPDHKEGLYFGAELPADHPKVAAGTPLFGRNLFPDEPDLRTPVLAFMEAMTELGHALLQGLALSLGLDAAYFAERYTEDPLTLFRIFHYPPIPGADDPPWSVAEHTDYGLLTMLLQDSSGGLEVRGPRGWVPAPPLADSFVCNIGDMLERMTGGLYRSTPHRVRNTSQTGRLSCPFFFDPNVDARIQPIESPSTADAAAKRWDGVSVHDFGGTYGEYLLDKVSKVFPELRRDVLGSEDERPGP